MKANYIGNKSDYNKIAMYDRQQYEEGFKDGMQAALEKIASTLTPRNSEICLLLPDEYFRATGSLESVGTVGTDKHGEVI